VEVREDKQIIRDLIERTAEDHRSEDYAVDYAQHRRDKDDLDVSNQEIEEMVEQTEFDAWTPAK
jgi:hypothetical protein